MHDFDQLVRPDEGLISPKIYSEQDIYERELEQVFGRSWLYLAHESQLPDAGSFLQTYMAEDPVLVVRQRDGAVKAFLNQCRHRGMRICRTDEGKAKVFTCTYHGWSYGLGGELINVPEEERAYRNEIDKDKWGATRVPRVSIYRGFIFATWDDEAPDLEEYLGGMAWYFDGFADRYDGGLEMVPGATKWVIDCNWKFAAEQACSDMYHVPVSHASAVVALVPPEHPELMPNIGGPGRQFGGNGHGSGSYWQDDIGKDLSFGGPPFGEWVEQNKQSIYDRIGEERAHKVWAHNTIFPNFSYLQQQATIRVYHPRGANQIEVWAWTYVPKNAPDKVKEAIRIANVRTFTPAGVFETDDGENWPEIQQVMRGWKARQTMFNAQQGLGHEERDAHGLPGVTNDVYSETAARGFYRRWAQLMKGMSWKEILEADRLEETKVKAVSS